MFDNSQVDAKALAFPSLYINGKNLKPVVVKTLQGAAPTGNKDEDLVPAGPQDLEAGQTGKWFANFKLPWGPKKEEPKDDGKRFPLRLFHLVDVSSSMDKQLLEIDGNPTRLEHVKDSIKKLLKQIPENLKAGIEHILIPYAENTGAIQSFRSGNEQGFLKAVDKLGKSRGTNIFEPINDVIKFINQSPKKKFRNLTILFSDGYHVPRNDKAATEQQAIAKFADLGSVNSAVFNVGIGESYKRSFMLDSLRKAQNGGLAHIPNAKGDLNLYESILPNFIRDLTTAPQFPIISFNKYFDRIINMSPTARQINLTQADKKTKKAIGEQEHFESIAGFQNEAYSVGFIEEDKINQGKIFKLVKDQANSQNFDEAKELSIQDFMEAALDPSEREQFQEYLLVAIKNLLLESDNPQEALKAFLEKNQVPNDIKKELDALIKQLNSIQDDAAASMSKLADQSVINQTRLVSGHEVPIARVDQGFVNTMIQDVSQTQVNSVNAQQQIEVNSAGSIANLPNKDLKRLILTFTNPSNNEQIKSLTIQDGETMTIGRETDSDLYLNDEKVSRNHAEITLEKGEVFIEDKQSRNGTKVNGKQIKTKTQLQEKDFIKIGSLILKISFRAS